MGRSHPSIPGLPSDRKEAPLAHIWNGQLGARQLRRIVYSADEIQHRVAEMGTEIGEAYGPRSDVLVLGMLKGSFIFVADLVRRIPFPIHVDFLLASSYGNDRVSSGKVRLMYNPEASMKGRHVILVEDIVDSGTTINRLMPLLQEREPASLEICTLLHKRIARLDWNVRWVGFDAPAEFLVGYGLDYAEDFRHLPYIGSI